MPIEMENALARIRRARGISAARLATLAGVSRQTIYAIEAGTYAPNTLIALRLARALETTVEELFSLAGDVAGSSARNELATILPGGETPATGQPAQLCKVGRRFVATEPATIPCFLPLADGVIAGSRASRASVQLIREEDFGERLLVAGCDPGISILARHVQHAGVELVLAHRNSSQALALLKRGLIHIAGSHLRDEKSGESNLPAIRRLFAKDAVAAVSFAVWEEGLLVARQNPKGIRGVEDLARADVSIVNREPGAGSRMLLDARLKRAGVDPGTVRGYSRIAPGHLAAAWRVHAGEADCCVATRAAARVFGLDFQPLVTERYDLVVLRRSLRLPAVERLFDALSRSAFRHELEAAGGYDTSVSGRRVL